MKRIAKAMTATPLPSFEFPGLGRIGVVSAKSLATTTFSVVLTVLPPGVTEVGEKNPVIPAGRPATLRLIAFVKEPLRGVSAMLYWPDVPTSTVCGLLVAEIEKSATTTAAPEPES
jgi:hypothetical protein